MDETLSTNAVLVSAKLRRQLHELFAQGKDDSEEADALREQMEQPWYAMSRQEQDRMRGLSKDLYALAEGGPPSVDMTDLEMGLWMREREEARNRYDNGDIDTVLAFLRKPRPKSMPLSLVHFMQARCWEKAGDFRTALVFMKAAELEDRQFSAFVMYLLNRASDHDEERRVANRILDDADSSPASLFSAASSLILLASQQQLEELCRRLIPILKNAARIEQITPRPQRHLQETELNLLLLGGMCHELLNEDQAALSAYDQALRQYPNDPDVWLRRGSIRFFNQRNGNALDDFRTAVRLRSEYCLPYLVLAKQEFDRRDFWEAYRYAKSASEKKGTDQQRSLAHQMIAMSLSMANQSIDWIDDNFRLAERLTPNDPLLAHNRAIAFARAAKEPTTNSWTFEQLNRLDARTRLFELGNRSHQQMNDFALVA